MPRAFAALLGALLLVDADPDQAAAAFPGGNGVIAYLRTTPGPLHEVAVIDPSGIDDHPITQLGKRLGPPAWSATGNKIAFFAVDATQTVLYTANADGTNLTPVFTTGTGGVDNSGPSWSPDGTKLAVVLGGGIYVIEVATGGATQVATNPSATFYYDQPAWSPNRRPDRRAHPSPGRRHIQLPG